MKGGERSGSPFRAAAWWEQLGQDLRHALRVLRHQPAFTTSVVLTLALGIGASAAMITIARGALVGSLPFANPDALVHVWLSRADAPAAREPASYPDLLAWRRDAASTFSALEGYDVTNITLTGVGEPVRLQGARVTTGFLSMLGVRPALGRLSEVRGDPAHGAGVVVSHAFWSRRLGGDPRVVGRAIAIDGRAREVIGVLPKEFLFAPAGDVEAWFGIEPPADAAQGRRDRWLRVVGRLRAGVGIEGATEAMRTVTRRLAAEHREAGAAAEATVVPLRDDIVGPVRPLLLALGGAVALVLLVASANVAGLLLARALAREREFAVRAAIGAGRARIVCLQLTESLLLAVAGGALGAGLAWAGITWLAEAAPGHIVDRMPFTRELRMDAGVLGLTTVLAIATGVGFGIVPALRDGQASLATLVRRTGASAPGSARRVLVVSEIALTTVLLVGAGLMMRSVATLLRVDPGFAVERVATMRLALAGPRYDSAAAQQRFFEELLGRVRGLPGAQVVGAASQVPLAGGGSSSFRVDGASTSDGGPSPTAMLRGVAGDYFRAMAIPLVAGRALEPRDDARADRVVVLSEGLARRVFGGASAVGRRLRLDEQPETAWTVVGVVGDVRSAGLDAPAAPTIYFPHLQAAENRMTIVVRTAGDAGSLLPAMRRQALVLDPLLPVYQAETMAERVAGTAAVYVRRTFLAIVGCFALVALLLAAVGAYGVIAYSVARRARELGIRAALGAPRGSLLALVAREGAAMGALGVAIGLAAAAAASRVLDSLLFGVRATDPITYGVVALLLAGTTLLATLLPARRATLASPLAALRADD